MHLTHNSVLPLLESVKVDKFYVVCYFKCDNHQKRIVSTVPFEPYAGKIEFTWIDILFHPIKSYNRYYHTPITIYGNDCQETIVLKAFEKVAENFRWDYKLNRYIAV